MRTGMGNLADIMTAWLGAYMIYDLLKPVQEPKNFVYHTKDGKVLIIAYKIEELV
jgi:hypothetical protein